MPRNYQLKTVGNTLPHNVYMQITYFIKDYPRLRRERADILHGSVFHDGQPRGNGTSDTTAQKAVKLAIITDRLDAIDRAVHEVGAHYSNKIKRDDIEYFDAMSAFEDYGCFCFALYDPEAEKQPSYRSWMRFKQTLAHEIARNLKII